MIARLVRSFSPRRDVIGLDLGTSRIKAAIIASGSRYTIKALATAPTPPGSVEGGVIVNEGAVAHAVADMLESAGEFAGVAYTAIGGPNLHLRWLRLPSMPEADLQSAARFEVASMLGQSAGQMAIRVRKQEELPDHRCQVLAIAASEQLVEAHSRVIELAGLTPGGIDVEPFAIMRALVRPESLTRALWRHQPVAILNIGGRCSDIYIIAHGMLRFARTLGWGGDRVSVAIAEATGMGPAEVDRLKEGPATELLRDGRLRLGDREIASEVMTSSFLGPLARELRRSLTYYASLHPENAHDGLVGEVVLSGSAASLRGLADYLGDELAVRVAVGDPFAQPALAAPAEAFPALRRSACGFATALGLAVNPDHDLTGRRDRAAAAG
jgi:type IV pilus assembly protein PilM